MSKRPRAFTAILSPSSPSKKPRTKPHFSPIKIATAQAAAAVDADPPLAKLLRATQSSVTNSERGKSVVYWMRMSDLRIRDNRALSQASEEAMRDEVPLVVVFLISPQDYIAHDRGPRRIDFTLRNLSVIKTSLSLLNIPLYTIAHASRNTLPSQIISILSTLYSKRLFANIEYEVDELRRDTAVCTLCKERGVKAVFIHDKCVVEPGVVLTKQNKAYTVYSPYQRNWINIVNNNISHYLGDCGMPHANPRSIYDTELFSTLFNSPIPISVPGFELQEVDKTKMQNVWPEGEEAAQQILQRFLYTRARSSQFGDVSPLTPDAEDKTGHSRILNYNNERDRADRDTTSRLSPYLSAGVISARQCIRATMLLKSADKVDASRDSGIGRWVQEIAWRDFYMGILAAFPRVSMGRPYLEKYAAVKWEGSDETESAGTAAGESMLRKWEDGMTGVPIVDAAMRCVRQMGWMHNRMRMISAMFLSKDLMVDWRLGERFFMQNLIDGDLASNNGGWQWCASTGVDPCPYFRIFNPYTQSAKADPTGDFIRHWVPELAKLKGSDIHKPPAAIADKLGYPRPIVNHEEARQRALRRYKNPGQE